MPSYVWLNSNECLSVLESFSLRLITQTKTGKGLSCGEGGAMNVDGLCSNGVTPIESSMI